MTEPIVFVVDDDQAVGDGLVLLLEAAGRQVRCFGSAEDFLQSYDPGQRGCLVLDVQMPGMSGPELQAEVVRRGWRLPIIFLTGHGDIPMSVRAIKAGAADFLTKPVAAADLLARIGDALARQPDLSAEYKAEEMRRQYLVQLTPREIEVLELVAAGKSNKVIGRQLHISFRTVELHRSHILRKTGAASMFELARLFKTLTPSAAAEQNAPSDRTEPE